jgi:hypothetical protein
MTEIQNTPHGIAIFAIALPFFTDWPWQLSKNLPPQSATADI